MEKIGGAMEKRNDIHQAATFAIRNYLAIREGAAVPVMINDPDKSKDVPKRHDLDEHDEIASAYMQEHIKTTSLVPGTPAHVAIVRETGPRYLQGILRTGKPVWTNHFHLALRVPHAERLQQQIRIEKHEPMTFVIWA
jgi:hypothetical protein